MLRLLRGTTVALTGDEQSTLERQHDAVNVAVTLASCSYINFEYGCVQRSRCAWCLLLHAMPSRAGLSAPPAAPQPRRRPVTAAAVAAAVAADGVVQAILPHSGPDFCPRGAAWPREQLTRRWRYRVFRSFLVWVVCLRCVVLQLADEIAASPNKYLVPQMPDRSRIATVAQTTVKVCTHVCLSVLRMADSWLAIVLVCRACVPV